MTTTSGVETAVYRRDGSAELSLDIFRPRGEHRGAAVLVFHGGGWRFGSREDAHNRAAALAAEGFTALAVQYRLLEAAPWPAPLADAAAALTWARAHAGDLGAGPGRIAVQGHSAGGHIALMTGTLPAAARPAAIVAYYPAIGFHPAATPDSTADFNPLALEIDEAGRIPSWMLLPPDPSAADLDAASPLALADATFPPTVLLHGTADAAIPYRASLSLHRRLIELGVPSDLHLYASRDHEFDNAPSMLQATAAAAASFLDRMVTGRERNDAEIRRYGFGATPGP